MSLQPPFERGLPKVSFLSFRHTGAHWQLSDRQAPQVEMAEPKYQSDSCRWLAPSTGHPSNDQSLHCV